MEQLNLFEMVDKAPEPLEDTSIKRVEVEITRTYDGKAILIYRLKGTIEEIKQKLTEYFERVKNILGIKKYRFLTFEKMED